MNDFDFSHLTGEAKKIAEIVYNHVKGEVGEPSGGGCRAFYSPEEWAARGEEYGTNSVLVLVYDGGDLAPFVNLDYDQYTLADGLEKALEAVGYYIEPCTCWYGAVYALR